MAILLPPAAANTGGALPTPPMSTDPAPIACSIGGPEVKSDQATLNGSLPIRPGRGQQRLRPGAGLVADVQGHPGHAGLVRAARPRRARRGAARPAPAAEDDEEDEHAVSTARLAAAARASTRFVRFIIVLPC